MVQLCKMLQVPPTLLNVLVVEKPTFLMLSEPISACTKEEYTQKTGRPSERTLRNILNNCSASQRKGLDGLDNLASVGLDAFDKVFLLVNWMEPTKQKRLWKHWQIVVDICREFTILIVHQQNAMALLIIAWSMHSQIQKIQIMRRNAVITMTYHLKNVITYQNHWYG